MIEATYAINEYIKTAVTAGGGSTGNFYPGRQAPLSERGTVFVTYRVTPNDTYGLAGLRRDTISYTFYNSSFEDLQKVVRLAMKAINVEDIQTTALTEPGIIFQEAFMSANAPGEGSDVEGEEFYFINAEIRTMYTEA